MDENKPKKIVIIGDGAVGKTCFLHRYIKREYEDNENYTPTIFENYSKEVDVNGEKKSIRIWDTAGQEEYDRIRGLAYPNTDVVLLTFSIIDRDSYENAYSKWYSGDYKSNMKGAKIILIGTKCDLKEDTAAIEEMRRIQGDVSPVTKAEGEELAAKIKAVGYFETSAKKDIGIMDAFDAAVVAAHTEKTKPEPGCDIL